MFYQGWEDAKVILHVEWIELKWEGEQVVAARRHAVHT
jgi:hypothetical protein